MSTEKKKQTRVKKTAEFSAQVDALVRLNELVIQPNKKEMTIMKIKKITSQHRRDFRAIYVCEHCGDEREDSGYDDDNFHRNVIPTFKCDKCGKTAPDDYRPLGTKYEAHEVV